MEPLGTVEKPYHVLTLILSPELNVAGGGKRRTSRQSRMMSVTIRIPKLLFIDVVVSCAYLRKRACVESRPCGGHTSKATFPPQHPDQENENVSIISDEVRRQLLVLTVLALNFRNPVLFIRSAPSSALHSRNVE
jgi:hypothetical protein